MLTPVWKSREKTIVAILVALWTLSVALFWLWWFQSSHVGNLLGFALTTIAIGWILMVPGYCFYFLLRMHKPHPKHPILNYRVAMIVTKVPSEPLSLIQKTLQGMLAQNYPHDTWVADEDPTPEALAWYKANGVKVSCRKDHPDYHQEVWPRRRKCKEGNLAYFYDHYGYANYDIVVQMDADHIPRAGYLEHMLRPFSDRSVGYVAAPSVCDTNTSKSWAARARAFAEAVFHGPVQSGSNHQWVPICIGSHYAVRTKALKTIGGIGPELAEDYSTTLIMNAHGWRGIWTYDAEAHGEGPLSFGDLMIQDYQWAKSLVRILLDFYPDHWSHLSWRQRLQFTFTQFWYPLGALSWFISFFLPPLALLTGLPPAHVEFGQFLWFILPPMSICAVIFAYARDKGHLRPKKAKLLSWENALFELARWPWVFIACVDGIIASITGSQAPSRVTPKRKASSAMIPFSILLPFIGIISFDLVALIARHDNGFLFGYFWFTLATLAAYGFLMVAVTMLHILEMRARRPLRAVLKHAYQATLGFFF